MSSVPEEVLLELSTAAHFASYTDLLSTILTLAFCNPSATTTTITSRDDFNDRLFAADSPLHQSPISLPQQEQQRQRNMRRLPMELGERVAHYLVIQRVDMAHVTATGCSSQQQPPPQPPPPLHDDNVNESSIVPRMPLSECLVDSDTSWWISQDSVEVEPQYVEFALVSGGSGSSSSSSSSSSSNNNHTQSACRLSAVAIRIPPLPMGPLSVREFRLDAMTTATNFMDHGNSTTTSVLTATTTCWTPITSVYEVENRTGWQRFVLPNRGVDVSRIRVVCLSNQFGHLNLPPSPRRQTTATAPYAQVGFYCVRFE
jgi:hypothetical protein